MVLIDTDKPRSCYTYECVATELQLPLHTSKFGAKVLMFGVHENLQHKLPLIRYIEYDQRVFYNIELSSHNINDMLLP